VSTLPVSRSDTAGVYGNDNFGSKTFFIKCFDNRMTYKSFLINSVFRKKPIISLMGIIILIQFKSSIHVMNWRARGQSGLTTNKNNNNNKIRRKENRESGQRLNQSGLFKFKHRVYKYLHIAQTSPGAHPASYPMSTGDPFSSGKAAGALNLTARLHQTWRKSYSYFKKINKLN
jgi:hypothetical protein